MLEMSRKREIEDFYGDLFILFLFCYLIELIDGW